MTCYTNKSQINKVYDLLDFNERSEVKQYNDLRSEAYLTVHEFVCKLAKVHGTLNHDCLSHQSRHSKTRVAGGGGCALNEATLRLLNSS